MAQFLGAANDNAFKMTLTLFVLASVVGETAQLRFNSLATFLFPLPFLLLSPLAGYLADRYSKDRMVGVTKAPEILAMAMAVVAFAVGSLPMLLGVLFLMATQSAFFSPAKYGLLPEAFAHEKLSMANGILNMTTNMAILVGSVVGVVLFARFRDEPIFIGWILLGVAVVGTLAALHVPRTPPGSRAAAFEWNPIRSSLDNWRLVRDKPELVHTLVGIAYFSFLGSAFLTVIPVYGKNVLGLSETGAGMMLMTLSIGIAAGSIVAGRLSQGRVEIGLVPLGSIGLTLFSLGLAVVRPGGVVLFQGLPLSVTILLLLLGLSAGFYIVPLNALLQQRSPEGMKGRLIAFSNVLSFSAVILAAALSLTMTLIKGVSTQHVVLVLALLTFGATVYILTLLPNFLVRLVLYLLTNAFYRIEVHGDQNIPAGGALFVANHVSWVDALLVATASDRMIRFLMYRGYYEAKPLNWLFKKMGVIPIARGDSPEQKEQSLTMARAEIERGNVVCIFAEGAITRTGNLLKFRRGFEQIASGMTAPIIPVCLDGVWGSIFSWERGRLLFKWPRHVRAPVRVLFGKPMPSSAKSHEVRHAVQELSVQAFDLRGTRQDPLEVQYLRRARQRWRRPFIADSDGRQLRFGQTLVRALALRRPLLGEVPVGERIGVMLPTGVDGALANLSLLTAGGVLMNLAFEEGLERVRLELAEARIDRIITSRKIAESSGLGDEVDGVRLVYIEDAERSLGRASLASHWIAARLLPFFIARRILFRGIVPGAERDAAIVFSDSPHLRGMVRGAALTHHNILSNMESLKQVFRLSREDRILGVLPLSTSFGLTGTVLLPAVAGLGVVYHHDPRDTEAVGSFAATHGVTVLPVGVDQLVLYSHELAPGALARLRHVVVAGGELPDAERELFHERFGVEPLEGFGCAECAPLISLNVPTTVRDARGQIGHRSGTSGHPLPGIAVKVIDSEGRNLPPDNEGALLVRGANVMRGYVGDSELTAQVLRGGWYITGYKATEDADGFLTISATAV
jgi:acyl-[acyl-carrier-protein]-phospholipid O-acyltransferase/long-chain-fatty-acid--[acyl-carrier-protein] ligase